MTSHAFGEFAECDVKKDRFDLVLVRDRFESIREVNSLYSQRLKVYWARFLRQQAGIYST